jgi:hypothetical protein
VNERDKRHGFPFPLIYSVDNCILSIPLLLFTLFIIPLLLHFIYGCFCVSRSISNAALVAIFLIQLIGFTSIADEQSCLLLSPFSSSHLLCSLSSLSVGQITLADYASCLAVKTFLHMANVKFSLELRTNAEYMSPTGSVPFIQAGPLILSNFQPIVSFVQSKVPNRLACLMFLVLPTSFFSSGFWAERGSCRWGENWHGSLHVPGQ